MKKTIIFLAATFICEASLAQASIGIQGTGNLGSAKVSAVNLVSPSTTMRAMPGAGIVVDMKTGENFFIRSGISYLQNGVKIKSSLPGVPGEIIAIRTEATSKLDYLQVPVNAMYISAGSSVQFYAGGGPWVSMGLGGNVKAVVSTDFSDGTKDVEVTETRAFSIDGGGASEFKRLDYGIGAVAGLKFSNGFFANIGYQFGLRNIDRHSSTDNYKSRSLQLSIGYYLWGR